MSLQGDDGRGISENICEVFLADVAHRSLVRKIFLIIEFVFPLTMLVDFVNCWSERRRDPKGSVRVVLIGGFYLLLIGLGWWKGLFPSKIVEALLVSTILNPTLSSCAKQKI